ncbi:MAG: cyclic diguanylate phosphodiesterase [Betaproteobacteria bacterium]|nr:MAG: cyclic diguanylate phosphodiesterase [Betaproteobacteria bacterium]
MTARTVMDSQTIYLARQPIVDRSGELVGYELLFRSADGEGAAHEDSVLATSTVVANAFAEIGLAQVIGPYVGHLNVDTEFLYSDMIEALPADRIVLELYEKRIDEATLGRLAELRRLGYRIALDDFVGNFDGFDAMLPAVDMVKVDFQRIDALLVPVIVDMLRKYKVRLIAQKVETPEQFELAKSLGMDLFQGFHFARPQVMSAKRAKPAKLALLRLLALALDDAETHAIEAEFKRHPNLSVNLIRLVNSAACRRGQSITSLRHALVLLGRRQLRVWLQLLLYTADRGNKSLGSPLLQLAAARGKLMELLASRKPGPESVLKELAFITGILSLMDVLLDMSYEEILQELNLPEAVRHALLTRAGEIGEMLALAELLERDDRGEVQQAVSRLGSIESGELVGLQLAAFQWANQVSTEAAA